MSDKLHNKLIKACQEAGIEVTEKPNGHYQLKGSLLVNYYPHSKSKSAYIAGTKKAAKHVTIAKAIEMCNAVPQLQGEKDTRGKNSREKRKKMLKKMPNCHWCQTPLTLNTSTIEHIIPLGIGGLDNANNRTLACSPCNESRGCDMPELNPIN